MPEYLRKITISILSKFSDSKCTSSRTDWCNKMYATHTLDGDSKGEHCFSFLLTCYLE